MQPLASAGAWTNRGEGYALGGRIRQEMVKR
jgi:hypothetical protein